MKRMRSKLWIAMMSLVLIMLILLWLFQIVFLEEMYTTIHLKEIKQDAHALINSFQTRGSDWSDLMDEFASVHNLSLQLYDSNGDYIDAAGDGAGMPMMMQDARKEAFLEAAEGRVGRVEFTHPRFGSRFMFLSFPIALSGVQQGILIIEMPLAPVKETAGILKQQLFYVTLILLVMALQLSYSLSKSFTKPLLKIKRVSESLAAGDYSVRVDTRKQDEIGQLAQTINHLGAQLGKTDTLRKDLIANVSHELRTPLSLIRGYAETIKDVTGDQPQKREKQLGIIIEESERLGRIVQDMLDLSRLQSGYFKLNLASVDITSLLLGVREYFTLAMEQTGVSLMIDAIGSYKVDADEDRLRQVLYNIINNSFNHTPYGGFISIKAEDYQDKIRVSVSDTGSGIKEEDLPHIFDRYYQSEKDSQRKRLGTGLGLAIVKEILKAHQAPYGAVSTIGAGTTIWFDLKKTMAAS